uniref:Capsular polysaccharide biosynthesis protein n=1 Tax=Loigolactobacillus rennini TaxID=238013 RepID=A0A1K2I670_9LACO|nr:hypothetical protein LREN565_0359 [Loigolactobacillus rennini]
MTGFKPSQTLQKLAHLIKVVCCSALIFALLGIGYSWLRPAGVAPLYQGKVLISFAKVQRQHIAETDVVHYSSGGDVAPLFTDTMKAPTTVKALQQALTKANLATKLDIANNVTSKQQKDASLVQIQVTSHQPKAAVQGANLAARVAVRQFKQRYHLRRVRILVPATQAEKQFRITSRGELILKSTFIGILLGFLWIFARELWQVHVTSK